MVQDVGNGLGHSAPQTAGRPENYRLCNLFPYSEILMRCVNGLFGVAVEYTPFLPDRRHEIAIFLRFSCAAGGCVAALLLFCLEGVILVPDNMEIEEL